MKRYEMLIQYEQGSNRRKRNRSYHYHGRGTNSIQEKCV